MRLFIAFTVPAEPLRKLQKKISFEGIKLAEDFHCTLKFLDNVDESTLPLIIEKLQHISFSPIQTTFGNVGTFPSETSPRIAWIGLLPEDKICALQLQIDNALGNMFMREEHFVPHVTLGRVKSAKVKEHITHALKQMDVPHLQFVIDEFLLMKSELKRSGPVYTVMGKYFAKIN